MSEKNSVKIKCNPYTQKIEYFRLDSEKDGWSQLVSYESPFSRPEFTNGSIAHKSYEILRNMNDIYNPGNVGLDLYFEGTKEDMEELSIVANTYFSDSKISVLPGQLYLLSAGDVKKQVEDIFEYMNNNFKEYPNNEVTEAINRFNEVIRPTIPICVMGLYSAGKSAFINSLIGMEILPSASDPTTAKTFKITSGSKYEIKFQFKDEYDQYIRIVLTFYDKYYKVNQSAELSIVKALEEVMKYDTIEERMYHAVRIINNYDMKYNKDLFENEKKWRVSDIIEVTVPIVAPILPFDEFDFIIFDTPGSNSASNTDHTEVLKKAMEGQTNGLPIFITTPDNMDGKDNTELIETINKLGGALDKSNLMIAVNKADDKSIDTLDKKRETFDKLEVSKLNPAGTYFVSSVMGLGFKKLLSDNAIEVQDEDDEGNPITIVKPVWIDKDYSEIFDQKKKTFKRKKDPMMLYMYNIIPQYQYDIYCALNIPDESVAYRNSGLHAVEFAIRDFAKKYALYNKCRMASSYLSSAIDKLENLFYEQCQEQAELSKKLQANMSEHENEVLNKLKKECKEKKSLYIGCLSDELSEVVKNAQASINNSITYIINIQWEVTKGKMGRKDDFTYRMNERLKQELKNLWNSCEVRARGFWRIKQDEFKNCLISIITESPYLTKEQQEILKNLIMQIDATPNYSFTYRIQTDEIFGGFLFIKVLKSDEAKRKFMEGFQKGITAVNSDITSQFVKSLDGMIYSVESQFGNLISKYNPKLLSLGEQIADCEKKLQSLQQQQAEIGRNLFEVENITAFKSI